MRWMLIATLFLAAGCSHSPIETANLDAVVDGSLEFSHHYTYPASCRQSQDESLECRVYSVWFTNEGNVAISTDRIGWTVNRTTYNALGEPSGWMSSNCPYAIPFQHFDVTPGHRVNLNIACMFPEGVIQDTVEAFHKTPPRIIFGVVAVD
ncbi:MAG: hypothetical protein ACPHID_04155 [Thermoplasmatota archaeon]